jgi:hypothetical protein
MWAGGWDGQVRSSHSARLTALLLWASMSAQPVIAEGGVLERAADSLDVATDISVNLIDRLGFLPVPIFVTEPAVGYGLGAAALFFGDAEPAPGQSEGAAGKAAPPAISGVGGFKTDNGSWGVGGGLSRSFADDRYRYAGGLGRLSLELEFFGPRGTPSDFRVDGAALIQQLTRRIGQTDWFLGGRYVFLKTESELRAPFPIPIDPVELDLDVGRLGLLVNFDSRDNTLTPNRGTFIEGEVAVARDWLGSDRDFESFTLRAFDFQPLGRDWILGLRGDIRVADGRTPFFLLPYVSLRGVPALRYQDKRTAVVETELRWNFQPKWAAVGFAGAGRAFGRFRSFNEAEDVVSGGVGIRYLIEPELGLYVGADLARGPEETAFYIQVGSAWR